MPGANRSQLPVRHALLLLLAISLCFISSSVQEKVLTFGSAVAAFHGAVRRFHFLIACGLLQEKASLVLSYWIKKLEFFQFYLLSHGDFLNAPTRCLMKCM
jgi:hypothetical protein